MPRIDLRADLAERPARWHLVAFIPFGNGPRALGLVPAGRHAGLDLVPRSFAVAGDGSFWITDQNQSRVAHLSPDGRFLGQIGGIPDDRFHPRLRDLAVVGDRLFVLEDDIRTPKAIVMTPDTDGRWETTRIVSDGRPLVLVQLIADVDGLVGYVAGYGDNLDDPTGPRGFARLDVPGSGGIRMLPGAPLAGGQSVDLAAPDGADLDVRFTVSGRESIQPIHVELVAHPGAAARSIPPIVGPIIEDVTGHQVIVFVQVGPVRTRDRTVGDGRWLLRLGTDGSPMLWERLPAPGIGDEQQFRHLAIGPGGGLYLMVAGADGERIYRR